MSIYSEVKQEMERHLFETALSQNQYNVSKTARLLGISRASLISKLRTYFGDKYIGKRGAK